MPKRGTELKTHPRGSISIMGFVPDKYYPKEGGKFRMFHHRAAGVMKFGDISLSSCHNVVEEDGIVYFEDKTREGKYVLVPCLFN